MVGGAQADVCNLLAVATVLEEEVGAPDDGKRPGLMDVRSVVERALGDGFVEE